ncbi:MAG: diguanylate cyclase [Gammaproteobacteria bacterium]|nr:MAG: diguanylate cyclase [Gammaproteobacteria bacterium]
MISFPGYRIAETLYKGRKSNIYRGFREADNTSVVIKSLNKQYPTLDELSGFRSEYKLLKSISGKNVINAYDIIEYDNSLSLILEDHKGETLDNLFKQSQLLLSEKLMIVIQMIDAISQIHSHHIIHKDINPKNFIYNHNEQVVKVIDFGIASELPREITSLKNPNILEGTLSYISPEQTGRMNRPVDYRTDFYSLGITLYWILTGKLPFVSEQMMELIHSHIAVKAVPPSKIDSAIPAPVSDIVMKLIEKNAEDRYVSALGIKHDLDYCLQELTETGTVKQFKLGVNDLSDKFQIPQKLYGRQHETDILISAFERIHISGSELMLVSGYSGIGKSFLINEIQKPIAKHNGHYISGKFERLKKDVPYSGFIQAFTQIAKQILAEDNAIIADWKHRIISGIGVNAKIITDLIPSFELILGEQQEVPELEVLETQNRFNLVLLKFFETLASAEQPLVIFLDDLQWADLASLHLLKIFVMNQEIQHMLIIGSYRHNEINDSHPFSLVKEEIDSSKAIVNSIFLEPLQEKVVSQLLSDTLNHPQEEVSPLAKLIVLKTGGNPFFINEFLRSLHREGLIDFSIDSGWKWFIEKIENTEMTDNVVDLMANRIAELSDSAKELLIYGSCIGNFFDLETLKTISEKDEGEIIPALSEIIKEGMLNKVDNIYRFTHDRVLEAAYSLIPDKDKAWQHYRIGRLELEKLSKEDLEDKIFYVVNQLNAGLDHVNENIEKKQLIELNLAAGNKALKSNAYKSSLGYFKNGISLLEKDYWIKRYDFTLEIFQKATVAAQLSANYQDMHEYADEVISNAQVELDKTIVYKAMILGYASQNQPLQGVRVGLLALEKLGAGLPEKPYKIRLIFELLSIKRRMFGVSIKDLVDMPIIEDRRILSIIDINAVIASLAYYSAPKLFPLIVLMSIKYRIIHGNNSSSSYAFAGFGLFHCGVLGDIESGYEFGQLALKLVDKFNAKIAASRTLFVTHYFINHWKKSVIGTLPQLLEGYKVGLDTGDLEFAALSAFIYSSNLYISGACLEDVETEMSKYSEAIYKLNHNTIHIYQRLHHQTVLNLSGKSDNPCKLVGDAYDADNMLEVHQKANDENGLFFLYLHSMILNYVFDNSDDAIEYNAKAELYLHSVISSSFIPIYYFYDSLIRLSLFPSKSRIVRTKYLKRVKTNQKKMKKWAFHAPMNYLHKYELVEAEIARVLNQDLKAENYYESAIRLARENKYLQEEALAHELAAKFWFELKKERFGKIYISDAFYLYRKWGATAKLQQMESRFPDVSEIQNHKAYSISNTVTATVSTSATEYLDTESVIRASQAISGEMDLEKLLKTMTKIIMENAGAEKVFVLIQRKDKLLIEASSNIRDDQLTVLESVDFNNCEHLSKGIVNYVYRTGKSVVLPDENDDELFVGDDYIKSSAPKSLLCIPMRHMNQTTGVLYLENNVASNVFTEQRIDTLKILMSQAAITIQNAMAFEHLEDIIKERTLLLQQSNEKLKLLTVHDPLTELYNRRYIDDYVIGETNNFISAKQRVLNKPDIRSKSLKEDIYGVCLVDIDFFKKVNDTYGHKAGDVVLKHFSSALKNQIRADDIIVRWGGEEFLIILKNTKPYYLNILSQKILQKIRELQIPIDNKTLKITCSMGVVDLPISARHPGFISLENAINIADFALYQAKESGRDIAVHFKIDDGAEFNEEMKKYLTSLCKESKINQKTTKLQLIK